jgi:peptidoglycan/LPS O-acetylase OafA/YrhL
MSSALQTATNNAGNGAVAASPGQNQLFHGLASSNIPALDGLRALAVFLVIFYHFGINWMPGGLGVLAFFVLSGFLITWLLLKENQKQGKISLPKFYMRRVLRIFPAFYVYWFGVVALLLVTGRLIPWRHAFSAFFYLGDYYNAIARPPDSFVSHTWSLAIEEQFYLLWPTLLYVFRRDLKRLTKVLVGIIAFVWVYRAFLDLVVKINQSYIYNAFDTRLDHLLVGCLLAVLLHRGVLKPLWQFLASRVYLPAVTVGLLVFSVYLEIRYGVGYRNVIGFTVDPLLVAILLVQLVGLSSTVTWKWINWSWVRYLGRISYSLYLYQEMTLYPARRILATHGVFVQLLAAVAGTVLIASASYYFIEKPFLRLKSRFESERKKVPSLGRPALRLQPGVGGTQTWNATEH